MHIRHERPEDTQTISRIQRQAFMNHPQHAPGAEPCEHRIVELLRLRDALSLSLVAETRHGLAGHVALSPATVGTNSAGWFLLGPIGVLPKEQGHGIGSALMNEAVRFMQNLGQDTEQALGIVLVGEPAFYQRFGFAHHDGLEYPGVPARYVLARQLGDMPPKGIITAHEAFTLAQA